MGELREALHEMTLAKLFELDPRFIGRVEAESEYGCWYWTGAKRYSGARMSKEYGNLHVLGTANTKESVHRRVYKLFYGEIPAGYHVHHAREDGCSGSGLCIQPRHLDAEDADAHRQRHYENLHRGNHATFR